MSETPEHRAAFPSRSGDTHVIGADGECRNVDQEARALRRAQDEKTAVAAEFFGDAAEMMGEAAGAEQISAGGPPAEPVARHPLDHDGDGRKGGMRGFSSKKPGPAAE